MDECRIDGCELPVFVVSRQMCKGHYEQARRRGQVPPRQKLGFCEVEGCGQPAVARNWCEKHYGRWKRNGRVEPTTLADRFWKRVDRRGDDECWEWTGSRSHEYGSIRTGGNAQAYVHRLSYEINVGPIPEGLQVDHLCRNTRCVNPAHLEPVTPMENTRRSENTAAKFARRTECSICGGPFSERRGLRFCPVCERRRNAAARERAKQRDPEAVAEYNREAMRRHRAKKRQG